ncbi:ribosomal RNA small subunit methyltransferase A [bacterium]|nr:ribosomal RNA small subunit methyltransferase A [bacterium]
MDSSLQTGDPRPQAAGSFNPGRSGIRPRKRLSQNFLRNRNVAKLMAESLHVEEGDVVLEIGPGEGVLTGWLLGSPAAAVFAVEVDERCIRWLNERFGEDGRLTVLRSDILTVRFDDLPVRERKIRVIGNLPYHLTSPILFHVLEQRSFVKDMTVMVQREVGRRLAAPPGSKEYGIPSVIFQLVSDVRLLFPVSKKSFSPVPKVDSAVVQAVFLENPRFRVNDWEFFVRFVRTVFNQRRKMLRNTIKPFLPGPDSASSPPVDLSARPEACSVSDLVLLANFLHALNRDANIPEEPGDSTWSF